MNQHVHHLDNKITTKQSSVLQLLFVAVVVAVVEGQTEGTKLPKHDGLGAKCQTNFLLGNDTSLIRPPDKISGFPIFSTMVSFFAYSGEESWI